MLPISLYKAYTNWPQESGWQIYNINPQTAIEKHEGSMDLIVYRINLKEGMPVIFLTNIMFYDNYHKTLPEGMDLSDEVIIDTQQLDMTLQQESNFRIHQKLDEFTYQVRKVKVFEYAMQERKIKDDK